jgi:membrane fusion protein, multidrug efflux system
MPDDRSTNVTEEHKEEEHKGVAKRPHPWRKRIVIASALIVVVAGLSWWLHSRHYESTDDAQVDGHTSGVATRIPGHISHVYVEENQSVKAGQVLVDLDPRDYSVALAQSRGQVSQARNQAEAEEPNVPLTELTNQTNIATASADVASAEAGVTAAERDYEAAREKLSEAEANNVKAQTDVGRYRALVEKDEISREQFDQVVANAKSLAATVAAAQASAAADLRQVDQRCEQLEQARQRYQEFSKNSPRQIAIRLGTVATRRSSAEVAQTQLDQAMLNMSYCKITTPVDGIVAKRTAEAGQYVAPGQQVVLVTQVNDLWVTANYRETQLRRMHPGESVNIHVDALAADFDGYLESMPAATGAITSLLPPENATGNFVKIVQRLPVRIRFKKNQSGLERLRPGMSVEPKVRVS